MNHPAFPQLPALAATGAALYLEPVAGSGERLCVAVAARLDDGAARVLRILPPEIAKCLVGAQADALMGLIGAGVASLERHIGTGAAWERWTPPLHGLSLSPVTEGRVDSLSAMLRTLAGNHSLLAGLADYTSSDTQPGAVDDDAEADWLTRVRQAVGLRNPTLDGHFRRKLRLFQGGAETRFDYVGQHLVAQLGRLIPGPAISRHVGAAKVKLWDLAALRDAGSDQLISADAFELLLYRPHDDDPAYSDTQIRRMHENWETLEEAGDKQSLRVRAVDGSAAAAARIVEAEA